MRADVAAALYQPSHALGAASASAGSTPGPAQRLVALGAPADLFRAADGDTAYAWVPVNGHRETWSVRSKDFRRWLTGLFYAKVGKPPTAQALTDALHVLDARAHFEGPTRTVWVRVAEQGGAVYLDLANPRWEAVEITGAGWRIVADPPVAFRRPKGMLSLPTPSPGASVDALRPFVNVGTEADWRLLVGWLLATLRPSGPYPVLVLHGEQGSAKSTTARVLRSLVDPNMAPLRGDPTDPRDLMISASNAWTLVYDNLSHLRPWLSDAFCRLATGGGFATRELYSDQDEVLFMAQRPILLNGVEELVTRGDLLDRSLLVYLPRTPEDQRRPESDFWHTFEVARPRLLGALLDAVSGALREKGTVRLAALPRLADFALWVTAAERTLGWPAGAFVATYAGNRAAGHELALDASRVAAAVRSLVAEQGSWTGTATELLTTLPSPEPRGARDWPNSPKAMSNALRRLAPNLRAVGVDVILGDDNREARTGRRLITISTGGDSTVTTVTSVTAPAWGGLPGDTSGDDQNRVTEPSGALSPGAATPGASGDDGDDGDGSTGSRSGREVIRL